MKTYPLESIALEQAKEKQFKLVDCIAQEFNGSDFLSMGDLGVVPGLNRPKMTSKIEKVIANFFDAESAMLVRGAGTGAIRSCLFAMIKSGGTILVHDAPIYPTTEVNIEAMGLHVVRADFNDFDNLKKMLASTDIDLCLIQHTRQKPDDSYNLETTIKLVNEYNIETLIDDNYAVMKVNNIGSELNATVSTFSSFKLFGPQGVGVIVGSKDVIDNVRRVNYSGGCQVQGHEAQEVLRGLTFAPVQHAIQSEVNEALVQILNTEQYPYVKTAFLANAQSKVLLVEFNENIAELVTHAAEKLGGLPNPVGAESKYELLPLFYRVSGTFIKSDPTLKQRMIRINPNRAGHNTILRILDEAVNAIN
ncbi:cysteine desulfurase [Vibrio sp. DW001]|uniref:aminotransferase class I/II-fold pyridoxal phosphate-dependent enzyme n=1 Tax=Vibrio sp. DW001 TaxID=2912315 RepID=UPI0023AEF4D4|nr:aminotransferase class I/II-fold pyridoxal phosphate-dependent enzyme [Vibrio sp. DW001]WED26280.1 cysteine desulfurase [Vibrio sp. DW001]